MPQANAHSKDDLETRRHSAAHVLAEAVLELFPDARLGIGPAVEDGFYYDFDLPRTLTPDDLEAIEGRMKAIIAADKPFSRRELPRDDALGHFGSAGQTYKVELIEALTGGMSLGARDDLAASNDAAALGTTGVSLYRQGGFEDLCAGPHVSSTAQIGAVKLLRVAGAYWRGDEKRAQLQRIYGTAWPTQADLDGYLWRLEEARKRDHRRLGTDLGLFQFNDQVGAGLPIWGEDGALLRSIVEDFWKVEHRTAGYQYVYSPQIGLTDLWHTSGHMSFYRENMYAPIKMDEQEFMLKPMNCPFHLQVYKRRTRSYRELPLRYNELGTVYRYEPAGTLHGLLRTRGFTQDDSHIFCRPDQLGAEVNSVLDLGLKLWKTFGFSEYHIELAVRDPANLGKYLGEDARWVQAEAVLKEALESHGLPYVRAEGEAVFYGPKIDLKLVDALGRKWQCTTIQVDFNFPERFDLTYIGEDGAQHRPFMVHRALLGSLERFIGVLVENYGGAFPTWLAPTQALVLPVADRHNDYAHEVEASLRRAGIRASTDTRSERVNAKIRDAQLRKVPYMLIVGDKEIESHSASVRLRSGENLGPIAVNDVVGRLVTESNERM